MMKKAMHFAEYFKRDLPFIETRLMNLYILWVRWLNIQTPSRIGGKSPKVKFTKCFPCNIFVSIFTFRNAYENQNACVIVKNAAQIMLIAQIPAVS